MNCKKTFTSKQASNFLEAQVG